MTKLEQLVEMAGTHARAVLTVLNQSVVPTWVLIDDKGKISITATSWTDEREKATCVAMMRARMREEKIVAYSVVAEAWSAVQPKGWKVTDPHVRPSEDPQRVEIVLALATDGKETEWRRWRIERNATGRVVALEPEAIPQEQVVGWMANMLKGDPANN
jgi:alkylated DNA nucleotide flippase Atl1